MKETKESDRRTFLKASGGALLAVGSVGVLETSGQHHKKVNLAAVDDDERNGASGSATVSFGGWMTPLDRFTFLPPPTANHHELIPNVAKIKAGGYVNFIISGLHVVAIYGDGTKPNDIDENILVPGRPAMTPPIINDSTNRIYRGIDPVIRTPAGPTDLGAFLLDRVEVVHFPQPGKYLVICAVRPHFLEGMFGYVRVVGGRSGQDGGE